MSLNHADEILFRAAADGAECVSDIAKKLPTWAASQINHFNKETGINKPFQRPDPDPKAKALPPAQGRACPKAEISKSAKSKAKGE